MRRGSGDRFLRLADGRGSGDQQAGLPRSTLTIITSTTYQAEGTGVEPATPFGAVDFESMSYDLEGLPARRRIRFWFHLFAERPGTESCLLHTPKGLMTATATSPSIFDQLVKRAGRLYSLPAVAMQVLELTNQPTVDARALKYCLEKDPALTTKILRVVNSSLFGMSREVSDLNEALTLLGTQPLKLLVLGFSLPAELLSDVETEVLERYWQHTTIKSVAAREISEFIWDLPGDEAFIAGLLQDLGVLVLVQSLGETYVSFLDSVYEGKGDLLALESEILGFDHAILSARLLSQWKLPNSIVQAVGAPHRVEAVLDLPSDRQILAQVLHLAELVTRFLVQQEPYLLQQLLDVGSKYCELSENQLRTLVKSLEEKVPQLVEAFSLRLPAQTSYADMLARAHSQLADATVELFPHICNSELLDQGAEELGDCVERWVGQTSDGHPTGSNAPVGSADGWSAQHPSQRYVDERGLLGLVTAAVCTCRQARRAISLAFVEIDEFPSLMMLAGPNGARETIARLARSIVAAVDGDARCVQVDDARFALILEGYDRQSAVETLRDLLSDVRSWPQDKSYKRRSSVSISGGLATLSMPPKNFPPTDLIDAAKRCLTGVHGDGLKSIEIY